MSTLKLATFTCMLVVMCAAAVSLGQTRSADKPSSERVYAILPLGDSITEGSSAFASYRYPLWERLKAAGYYVTYVGSRKGGTRVGEMAHEGYGGKPVEYLASNIETLYAQNPADVVLLHAGHNHTVEEQPIPKIIAATETIVTTVQRINPNAIILVAQVIPSGKLPKYSYIPELNVELAKFVDRVNETAKTKVMLVDQATGFDVDADTVADKVHPNPAGAEKMATRWFETLRGVLAAPADGLQPKLVTYKKGTDYELKLHVFQPTDRATNQKPRAAIVYFFGGGWANGTPLQFYNECRRLASAGMVAISADYRIASVNKTSPIESVADAQSAIRWVRAHAGELGVDPSRITAAGASAGGHLAAIAGVGPERAEPGEDAKVSSRPDAMVLMYPVLDMGPGGYRHGAVKDRYAEYSPLHALGSKPPPSILFMGDKDGITSVETMLAFAKKVEDLGGRCEVHIVPNGQHPLYSYHFPPNDLARDIADAVDGFLRSVGYIER